MAWLKTNLIDRADPKEMYVDCFAIRLLRTLASFSAISAVSVSICHAAEAPVQQYGIFFDSVSGNYFSNNKPAFSIRPVGQAKHIDRIEVSINDAAFETYKGQIGFKEEGLHTIRFRAVDPVLNWSPVQTFRVFVDLKAPVTAYRWDGMTFKGETTLFVHPDSKVLFTAEDNLSGVNQVAIREGAEKEPRPLRGPLQFKQDGVHEVVYSATDNVGNIEPWTSVKFTVDGKAPKSEAKTNGVMHVREGKSYVNFGSSVALTALDEGSGVATIEYRINEGPIAKYSSPIILSEASVQLRYRAIDRVGNEEPWAAMNVYQDTVPPLVQLTKVGNHVLTEGKVFAQPGFAFKAQVSDEQSGLGKIKVSKDGAKFDEVNLQLPISFDAPGTYSFQVKAVDNVGNTSEATPMTVVIDNAAPQSSLKARQSLVSVGDYFLSGVPNQIDIAAADQGVGLQHVEISYDGKSYSPLKGPIDLATWDSPRRTLYYRAVDSLGNQEAPQTVTIELSTVGPKVDLFVENAGLPEIPLQQLGTKPNPQAKGAARVPASIDLSEEEAAPAAAAQKKPVAPAPPTSAKVPAPTKQLLKGK